MIVYVTVSSLAVLVTMWSEYVPEGWTLIVSTIGIEPAMGYRVLANDVYNYCEDVHNNIIKGNNKYIYRDTEVQNQKNILGMCLVHIPDNQ